MTMQITTLVALIGEAGTLVPAGTTLSVSNGFGAMLVGHEEGLDERVLMDFLARV